jgi:chromosome partitioning protein
MRIRRRDRSEPTPQVRVAPIEVPEVLLSPPEDLTPAPAPPIPVDVPDLEGVPAVTFDPHPPPFDQALLPPGPSGEFVPPSVAEVAPSIAKVTSTPPVTPAPPAASPPPPPIIDPAPEVVYVPPEPVPTAPEPARVVAAEPVFTAPAPVREETPIVSPAPEPARATEPEPVPAIEDVVVPEVELPVEPKHARESKPTPRTAPESSGPPQMRTPSIRAEADSLLDGERPAPRELPRVIAIANQKGGVGKTTTTVNLGAALAEIGYRVLVIDLDPQGNATTGLGIDARNFELSMYDVIMRDQSLEDCIEPTSVKNLFVAPATIDLAGIEIELVPAFSREMKLKRAIDTVVDDFDFILIDCPPSLGLITVNGLAAAGEVMVPIQCEYYALEGLSQLLRNVNLVSSNLNETLEVTTIVLTMFDARTRLSIEVANEVRLHFADRVCKSVIPRTVRLSEAPSFGQPITVFDPTSRGAVAYRELAKEVSNGAPQRTR